MWMSSNAACAAWLWAGVLGAANATAAQGEAPSVGYYRVERSTHLYSPSGGPSQSRSQLQMRQGGNPGTLTWQFKDAEGRVAQRVVASPPEHQCVHARMNARDWRAVLRQVCQSGGTKRCGADAGAAPAQVQVRALAAGQWELRYPLRLATAQPGAVDQMTQALSDPRLLSGLSPQEREQMRAAMAQVPSGAQIASSHAELAAAIEADPAAQSGPDAAALRAQAAQLRAGDAGFMHGEAVERWTRVAERCPG